MMSVPYKVVKVTQPGIAGGGVVRYQARVAGRKTFDFWDFADDVAKASTVSHADAIAVLTAVVKMLPEKLKQGYVVKMAELGVFSLHIKSDVVDTPEEVNRHTIKQANIHFRAGAKMKRELIAVDYVKIPNPGH